MRGPTPFDIVIAVALVGLAAIVVVPQRAVKRIMDNEDRVIEDLRDLERRLVLSQKAAQRDRDGDGVGEYAPLSDILGARAAAARRVGLTDVWEMDGYYFAVMVPGPRKFPVLAGSEGDAPDFAEVSYMLVAWPAEPGVTGMRAYLETPQGVLRHQIDGYPYGLTPPAPEWPLIQYEGEKVRRGPAYAGNDWKSPAQDLRK